MGYNKVGDNMKLVIDKQIIEIEVADTFRKRLVGLLMKEAFNKALLLKNIKAIHTLGMKFNIDIIFLDKDYQVIGYQLNIAPNKIIKGAKNTKHILELDTNITMNKSNYKKLVIE